MAPKKKTQASTGRKIRRPTMASISAKKQRIGNMLKTLDEEESSLTDGQRVERDILAIVNELVLKPQQIERTKKYVLSDMFEPEAGEDELHETIIKLERVPQSWFVDVLKAVYTAVDADMLANAAKVDKKVRPKLFYWLFNVSPNAKVPRRVYSLFLEYFRNRTREQKLDHNRLRKILDSLSSAVMVPWDEVGVYELHPACLDTSQPHQYTHIMFRGDASSKVPLPEILRDTEHWEIAHNYCADSAKLVSPGPEGPSKYTCLVHSFFPELSLRKLEPSVEDWRYLDKDDRGAGTSASPVISSPSSSSASPAPVPEKPAHKITAEKLKSMLKLAQAKK